MSRLASSASLTRICTLLGLATLAALTLAPNGATRMYAWPWSAGFWVMHAAAAGAFLARLLDRDRPLNLPARPWLFVTGASALVVIASALASPYRGTAVLGAATPLAALLVFLLAHDWLAANPAAHPERFARAAAWAALAFCLVSTALWLADIARFLPAENVFHVIAVLRNPHPLGHSNYTAGLLLLALPWLAHAALQATGRARLSWSLATALALALLLISGSRGGLLGLGALGLWLILTHPGSKRTRLALLGCGAFALIAIAFTLPRTRALLLQRGSTPATESDIQRAAMLRAGTLLGRDRPALGWGPNTTPLAYPRVRQFLNGGAENVLQLHNTPIQLFAEYGAAGLLCAGACLVLLWRARVQHPTAAAALVGYAAFALTDWQLDVPVFAFAVAAFAALLSMAKTTPAPRSSLLPLSLSLAAAIALIATFGQRDPAPALNIRALALARDPAHADEAIALLRQSLALNPAQEIAHFNLGWLLVVRDPAVAETHFLAAAHLVPDKGGVYFGLALARLNQGHSPVRALALECLNDPAFLASPWWSEPSIASQRTATIAELSAIATRIPVSAALTGVLAFAQAPLLTANTERIYRRERTGYPVLMRNLDLPAPTDVFDVREPIAPPTAPLPKKGWLPAPLLIGQLDAAPR